MKSALCTVRLTEEQLGVLDQIAEGELSRSQLVRMLVEDFVRKPKRERHEFVFKRLFGDGESSVTV
jgi:hypothetical protein